MQIDSALILCAGFGKRLNPLTLKTPKPLLMLKDLTVLEHCINLIIKLGIKKIYLNTFYLGEQISNFIKMSGKLIDRIPTLALSDFLEGSTELKNKFVKDLGGAFESIGFVAIKNHGYSIESQSSLYSSIKEFYELPDELKIQYEHQNLR